MRLSQIKWTRHNRELDRSQLLFSEVGDQYLVYRPVSTPEVCSLHAYLGGVICTAQDRKAADDMLSLYYPYDPTQMTPLERKCWELAKREQAQ